MVLSPFASSSSRFQVSRARSPGPTYTPVLPGTIEYEQEMQRLHRKHREEKFLSQAKGKRQGNLERDDAVVLSEHGRGELGQVRLNPPPGFLGRTERFANRGQRNEFEFLQGRASSRAKTPMEYLYG